MFGFSFENPRGYKGGAGSSEIFAQLSLDSVNVEEFLSNILPDEPYMDDVHRYGTYGIQDKYPTDFKHLTINRSLLIGNDNIKPHPMLKVGEFKDARLNTSKPDFGWLAGKTIPRFMRDVAEISYKIGRILSESVLATEDMLKAAGLPVRVEMSGDNVQVIDDDNAYYAYNGKVLNQEYLYHLLFPNTTTYGRVRFYDYLGNYVTRNVDVKWWLFAGSVNIYNGVRGYINNSLAHGRDQLKEYTETLSLKSFERGVSCAKPIAGGYIALKSRIEPVLTIDEGSSQYFPKSIKLMKTYNFTGNSIIEGSCNEANFFDINPIIREVDIWPDSEIYSFDFPESSVYHSTKFPTEIILRVKYRENLYTSNIIIDPKDLYNLMLFNYAMYSLSEYLGASSIDLVDNNWVLVRKYTVGFPIDWRRMAERLPLVENELIKAYKISAYPYMVTNYHNYQPNHHIFDPADFPDGEPILLAYNSLLEKWERELGIPKVAPTFIKRFETSVDVAHNRCVKATVSQNEFTNKDNLKHYIVGSIIGGTN